MTKGRNTSVISVRLPDETVKQLKTLGRSRRQSMTDLLRPLIDNFAASGRIPVGEQRVGLVRGVGPAQSGRVDQRHGEGKGPEREKGGYPGTARSALCPCGSGRKYKRCCEPN